MDLDIKLGDNAKYNATRLGTVAFRRGSDDLLEVKDVLYILGPMKNLLSISQMEDKGMTITFDGARLLIYLRGASSNSRRVIGVRRNKLYRFLYQPAQALLHSMSDVCELWHRKMVHLHHGTLNVLRDVMTSLQDFKVK